jgi:hypothetical protein
MVLGRMVDGGCRAKERFRRKPASRRERHQDLPSFLDDHPDPSHDYASHENSPPPSIPSHSLSLPSLLNASRSIPNLAFLVASLNLQLVLASSIFLLQYYHYY